jgi:hypothetical protein
MAAAITAEGGAITAEVGAITAEEEGITVEGAGITLALPTTPRPFIGSPLHGNLPWRSARRHLVHMSP